jgi:hypothetical protein
MAVKDNDKHRRDSVMLIRETNSYQINLAVLSHEIAEVVKKR